MRPNLPEPKKTPVGSQSQTYDSIRSYYYYDIGHQLDCLWHDIDRGLFGEAAKTGDFYQWISQIKQQIPKPGDSV